MKMLVLLMIFLEINKKIHKYLLWEGKIIIKNK